MTKTKKWPNQAECHARDKKIIRDEITGMISKLAELDQRIDKLPADLVSEVSYRLASSQIGEANPFERIRQAFWSARGILAPMEEKHFRRAAEWLLAERDWNASR